MIELDGTTYLTSRETADLLGLSEGHLRNQRWLGISRPEALKVNRTVVYRKADVDALRALRELPSRWAG